MKKKKSFILYRIYYGDSIVYLGRTKQPLQDRIRGHVYKHPLYRSIFIEQVTKIEYAEFQTEADMNLYEIYFINLWKPPLNIDDKTKDELTLKLPEVEWKLFTTPLWEKWKEHIKDLDDKYHMRKQEEAAKQEYLRDLRARFHRGEISEEEYYRITENT